MCHNSKFGSFFIWSWITKTFSLCFYFTKLNAKLKHDLLFFKHYGIGYNISLFVSVYPFDCNFITTKPVRISLWTNCLINFEYFCSRKAKYRRWNEEDLEKAVDAMKRSVALKAEQSSTQSPKQLWDDTFKKQTNFPLEKKMWLPNRSYKRTRKWHCKNHFFHLPLLRGC